MPRCADCGFLAVREVDSRDLLEAEAHYRETGVLANKFGADRRLRYEHWPTCFAMKLKFNEESHGKPEELLPVIRLDRTCDRFVQWNQGYTPKEHDLMLASEIAKDAAERQQRMANRWMLISATIQGGSTLLAAIGATLLAFWLARH
jgi:hypothetical protein